MDILSIDKHIAGFKQKFKQFRLRYLTFGRSDYVTVSKKLGIFGLWLLEKSFKLVAIVAAGVVLSANGTFAEKLKTGFSSLSGALRKLFEFPAEMDRMGTIIHDYNHLTAAQFNTQYGSEALDSLLWNLNAGIDYLILVYQNLTNQPISTLVACALAFGTFWILSRVLRFYRQKGRGTWLVRLERRLGEKIFKLNRFGSGTGLDDQKSPTSVGAKANGKSNINKYKRRRLRISPVATEIASNSKKSDSGSKVDGYLSKAKSNSVSQSKSSSGGPSKKSVNSLAKKKEMARKIAQLKNKPKSDNPALYRKKINEGVTDKEPATKPADTVLAMKPKPASPDLQSGYELKESNGKPAYDLENSGRESKTDQPESNGQEEKDVIKAETSMQEMKVETQQTETDAGEELSNQNNQDEEQTTKTTDIPSASKIKHEDSGESEEKIQAVSSTPEQEMETDTSSEETVSKVESHDIEDVEEKVPQDVNEEEIPVDENSESTNTVESKDQSTVEPDELKQASGKESEVKLADETMDKGDSDPNSGLPTGDVVEEPVSETLDSEVRVNGNSTEPENQAGDEIESPSPKAETKLEDSDVIQLNGNGEMDSISNENEDPEKQDPEPTPDSGQEPQVDKEQQDQKEDSPEEKKKSRSPYNSTSTANIKSLQSAIRQARSS